MRRKAALEKATARRLLNKSMELYEDEQLELMELAAASKGLSSIISIDPDTNLDAFRGRCFLAFSVKRFTTFLLKRKHEIFPLEKEVKKKRTEIMGLSSSILLHNFLL